ncbi:hypothetical protein IG631_21095 [Alternaria alternata]|nr:hypothetical protein IG631_21095 [Alternaria alternata]
MTAPAVHVGVIPVPHLETSPTTVSIGGSSQRAFATGHVTSRPLRIGPSSAQTKPYQSPVCVSSPAQAVRPCLHRGLYRRLRHLRSGHC